MNINVTNKIVLLFIFSIGTLLSFLLLFWLLKSELEFTEEKFSQLINQYSKSIENTLKEETYSLNALAAYHYGSEYITFEEFKVLYSLNQMFKS